MLRSEINRVLGIIAAVVVLAGMGWAMYSAIEASRRTEEMAVKSAADRVRIMNETDLLIEYGDGQKPKP